MERKKDIIKYIDSFKDDLPIEEARQLASSIYKTGNKEADKKLRSLNKLVTDRIKSSVNEANPALTKHWNRANAGYKEYIDEF